MAAIAAAIEPETPRISGVQARLLRVLMGLVMFVTGSYVGVDWAAFYYHFQSPYPARAGYARTILCTILVLMIGRARVDQKDARGLLAAFVITLMGDYCLTLHDWMIPGTLLFVVVHGILIARHARGFGASLAPPRRAASLRGYALTALLAYGGAGALVAGVKPILQRTHMYAIDASYVALLATSMWMAWGTLIRSFYGRRNAWYIAIGMTCFFFCDISVGVGAALSDRPAGTVLDNMVGFFYSPALVLLAYSGYHWRTQVVEPAPVVPA